MKNETQSFLHLAMDVREIPQLLPAVAEDASRAMMEPQNWYYADGENIIGPFVEERLRAFRAANVIADDTMVCRANSEHWERFRDALPAPSARSSPLPGRASHIPGERTVHQLRLQALQRGLIALGVLCLVLPVKWLPTALWIVSPVIFSAAILVRRFFATNEKKAARFPEDRRLKTLSGFSALPYALLVISICLALPVIAALTADEPTFLRSGWRGMDVTEPALFSLSLQRLDTPVDIPSGVTLSAPQKQAVEELAGLLRAKNKLWVMTRMRIERASTASGFAKVLDQATTGFRMLKGQIESVNARHGMTDPEALRTVTEVCRQMSEAANVKTADESQRYIAVFSRAVDRFGADPAVQQELLGFQSSLKAHDETAESATAVPAEASTQKASPSVRRRLVWDEGVLRKYFGKDNYLPGLGDALDEVAKTAKSEVVHRADHNYVNAQSAHAMLDGWCTFTAVGTGKTVEAIVVYPSHGSGGETDLEPLAERMRTALAPTQFKRVASNDILELWTSDDENLVVGVRKFAPYTLDGKTRRESTVMFGYAPAAKVITDNEYHLRAPFGSDGEGGADQKENANGGQSAAATAAPTPMRRLAKPGIFYILEYASVRTSKGMYGIEPGREVHLVRENKEKGTVIVSDGPYQLEVVPYQLTNDLDVALAATRQDQASQAQVAAGWGNQNDASVHAQRQLDIQHARNVQAAEERRVRGSVIGGNGNPLDLPSQPAQ